MLERGLNKDDLEKLVDYLAETLARAPPLKSSLSLSIITSRFSMMLQMLGRGRKIFEDAPAQALVYCKPFRDLCVQTCCSSVVMWRRTVPNDQSVCLLEASRQSTHLVQDEGYRYKGNADESQGTRGPRDPEVVIHSTGCDKLLALISKPQRRHEELAKDGKTGSEGATHQVVAC